MNHDRMILFCLFILTAQVGSTLGKQIWSVTCYGNFVNISCPNKIVIHSAFLGLFLESSEYNFNNRTCQNAVTEECVDDVTLNISSRCSGEKKCIFKLVKSIHLDVKQCKSVAKKLPNLFIKYECVPADLFIQINDASNSDSQLDDYKVILLLSTGGYISSMFYSFQRRPTIDVNNVDIQLKYKLQSMHGNHHSKSVYVVFKLKDISFISQGKAETCEIGETKMNDYLRIDYNNQKAIFCALDEKNVFPRESVGPVALSNVSLISNVDLNSKPAKSTDRKGILLQYILIYCDPIKVSNGTVSYDFRYKQSNREMEVTTFARITCNNGLYIWSTNLNRANNVDIDCNSLDGEWITINFSLPLNCVSFEDMRQHKYIPTTTQVTRTVTSERKDARKTTLLNTLAQPTSNYSLVFLESDEKELLSSDIAGLLGGVMGFVFCLVCVIGGICYWKKKYHQKHKSFFSSPPCTNSQFMLNSMSPTVPQGRRLTTDFDSYHSNLYSQNFPSINSFLGTASLNRTGFLPHATLPSSSFSDANILNAIPRESNDPSIRTLPIKASSRKKSPLFWRSCSDNRQRDSKRMSKTFSISQLKSETPHNFPQSMNHDISYNQFPSLSTYTETLNSRQATSPIRFSISTQRTTLYNEVPYSSPSVETYLEPVLMNGVPQKNSQSNNTELKNKEQYMLYNMKHGNNSPPPLLQQIQSANNDPPPLLPFSSVPVERRLHNRSVDLMNSFKNRDRNSNTNNRASFFGMQSNHYYGDEGKSQTPSDNSVYESLDDENEQNEASLVATAPLSTSLPLIPSHRQRIALPPAPVAMAENYDDDDDMLVMKYWEDSSEEDMDDSHYESEYGYQPVRIVRSPIND